MRIANTIQSFPESGAWKESSRAISVDACIRVLSSVLVRFRLVSNIRFCILLIHRVNMLLDFLGNKIKHEMVLVGEHIIIVQPCEQ